MKEVLRVAAAVVLLAALLALGIWAFSVLQDWFARIF